MAIVCEDFKKQCEWAYGAAIWDLEVKFEFLIPATFDKDGKQLTLMNHRYFQFAPVTKVNPLNSGQASKFEFRRPEKHQPTKNCPDTLLRTLPPRLVAIVAYSGTSRNEIARFRSSHVRSKIYAFFNAGRRDVRSVWDRLDGMIFKFIFMNKTGQRFRFWVESLAPGLFDVCKGRIQRLISGRGPMERDEY